MLAIATRSAHPLLDRARAAVTALELAGLHAAALSTKRQWLAANAGFERLAAGLFRQGCEHVRLVNAEADQLLCEALSRLQHDGEHASPQPIPYPRSDGRPPVLLQVLPVGRAARTSFSGMLALLTITAVVRRNAPAVGMIQRLFEMTPAEARVARSVAEGGTVPQIAERFALSPETVRSQLKAALAKTGSARNIDLAVLLAAASPIDSAADT